MGDEALPVGGVAIVGMAGRFPAARSVRELWQLLIEGREATRWLTDAELLAAGENPDALRDPNYVRAALLLPDMEMFDAGFFGFTPREAAILDPQHRQFLETCWEALEDAGHPPARFPGSVGVFAGCGMQAYMARNVLANQELVEKVGLFLLRHTGNDKDFLTTRVSYLLNLQGPSVGVQTACSTSLVAVHLACQSLIAGECDMALAGGVSIEVPHVRGYRFAEGEVFSSSGRCKAFDDNADGVLFGSGVGIVALRRLEDAVADGDHIYAVIRGSAINNDGASKAGYFAPSEEGQARAAAEALAIAGVDPSTVDYIEAHGTGTLVGDPIELAALNEAYREAERGAIQIGSIKTNIGHLDTAAGVASLIKAALALEREHIPATLNFSTPNSRFDFASSPFQVAAAPVAWRRGATPRRASVNSLGVGGTNAHVVIEEAPRQSSSLASTDRQLVVFSAKTEASLNGLRRKWVEFLNQPPEDFSVAEAAFTTQEGREPFKHRLAVVASTPEELRETLERGKQPGCAFGTSEQAPSVVFMFPGGGAQFPGAGRALYDRQPSFRAAVDACFAAMPDFAPADLQELMFKRSSQDGAAAAALEQPLHSVLAVFILEYALASMWLAWGVKPAALIGHSAGEYAAATIAGVMTLKDALKVVALRGRIFAEAPPGGMISVKAGLADVRALTGEELDIAVVNGPQLVVVSGPDAALRTLSARCAQDGIETSRIRINVAAHSRMLDPALPRFRSQLEALALREPTIPIISGKTGRWSTSGELKDSGYWVGQLRDTVHFHEAVCTALERPRAVLLEVGPGQGLSALARLADGANEPTAVLASSRLANDQQDDELVALSTAGALWANGVSIDFDALSTRVKRRISVPTYAFEKQRHWVEPSTEARASLQPMRRAPLVERTEAVRDWIYVPKWIAHPLPPAGSRANGAWLVFADQSSGISARLLELLQLRGVSPSIVTVGDQFERVGPRAFKIAPRSKDDYDALLTELAGSGQIPSHILHLWSLDAPQLPTGASIEQPLGFDSVFLLGQAMQLHGWEGARRLCAITSGALAPDGDGPTHPERAALVGPCRVLPREIRGLVGQLIDVDVTASPAAAAESILGEADSDTRDEIVAFRDGRRLVPTEEPEVMAGLSSRLRQRGVYLITGGLGAIALELSEYLARSSNARLVLTTRREVPARAQWPSLAERNDYPLAETLSRLLDIEALGAEIVVVQCDVSEVSGARRGIAAAQAQFGTLNGVFHLAGAIDDAPVASKTLASAYDVITPKLAGAFALDALLAPGSLDVFALASSTSVLLGPPGQTDYVAANAVMEALAARRADGLAVALGVWGDIGLAARLRGASNPPARHPLLGVCQSREPEIHFISRLRASAIWALREHKVDGCAILPGAAYIDIVAEAAAEVKLGTAIRIDNINFIRPLACAGGSERELRTKLAPMAGGAYRVEVESRCCAGEDWLLHFEAKVTADPTKPTKLARPKVAFEPIESGRLLLGERGVQFGRRWMCLESASAYGRLAACEVELPAAFSGDLETFRAHPALLDVGAAVGLFLVPRVAGQNGLYAPLTIDSIVLRSRLPRRFSAFARLRDIEPGTQAAFDVDFCDPSGRVIAEIRGLTQRWVEATALKGANGSARSINSEAPLFDQMLAAGIRAEDASQLFEHVFASGRRQVIASSIPLSRLRSAHVAKVTTAETPAREVRAVDYSDEIEASIAHMCADILGVEQMRPQDEFLSYGGGSLAGVRLFARIRKEHGIDLSLSALFKAPTVRALADLVRAQAGRPDTTAEAAAEVHDSKSTTAGASAAWSPLVRISGGAPYRRPLFCVHGAGGNVITFKALADRLARDLPIVALEARGIDGRAPFHTSIEEAAECNLEAIFTVDNKGPYRLAGFSGGGVIAFEMARRLSLLGRNVELLVMFDTLAPGEIRKPLTIVDRIRLLRRSSLRFLLNWPQQKIAYLLEARRIRLAESGRAPASASHLEVIGAKSFDAYVAAQSRFEPQPYDGNVLLFRARHAAMPYVRAGRALGWEGIVRGRIEEISVDAWHATMFAPPAVDVLAAVLDARLDALDIPEQVHAVAPTLLSSTKHST